VAYPFLSSEWEAEAREIRAEYQDRTPAPPPHLSIRMNVIITDVPFEPRKVEAHVDTSSGALIIETGHVERPDVTVTMEYGTTKTLLMGGDPQALLMAFLGGRIKVDGDISKLLELQGSGAIGGIDPVIVEIYQRIRAITE
jgi:hypothetical protein